MAKKGMMKMLGKRWYYRIPFNLVVGSIILVIFSFITGILGTFSGTLGSAFSLILAAVFLMMALVYHKGKESFINALPMVIIIAGLSLAVLQYISFLNFSVTLSDFTLNELLSATARLFGSYYLSDGLFQKYIK